MENKEDLKRLLDFYLFSDLDDEAELDLYLSKNSIRVVEVANHINDLLRQKRAELRLKKGREFKERYLQMKNDKYMEKAEKSFSGNEEDKLAYAYRGKTDSGEDTEDDIRNILELIRKAKEENKN